MTPSIDPQGHSTRNCPAPTVYDTWYLVDFRTPKNCENWDHVQDASWKAHEWQWLLGEKSALARPTMQRSRFTNYQAYFLHTDFGKHCQWNGTLASGESAVARWYVPREAPLKHLNEAYGFFVRAQSVRNIRTQTFLSQHSNSWYLQPPSWRDGLRIRPRAAGRETPPPCPLPQSNVLGLTVVGRPLVAELGLGHPLRQDHRSLNKKSPTWGRGSAPGNNKETTLGRPGDL